MTSFQTFSLSGTVKTSAKKIKTAQSSAGASWALQVSFNFPPNKYIDLYCQFFVQSLSGNECYLMSSLSQELELSVYEGWISGVANCNQSTISFKDNTTEIIGPIVENISKCQASASSIFDNAENFYGPDNAVDGILMATDGATGSVLTVTHYMSDPNDPSPWVQLDCGSPVSIAIVMITAMYDIEVRNVSIHVGNKMAMFGQQSQNQLCAPTVNEIAPRSYKVIECVKVVHGQFVQFQMQSPMSLQEVIVFFPTQWPPGKSICYLTNVHFFL